MNGQYKRSKLIQQRVALNSHCSSSMTETIFSSNKGSCGFAECSCVFVLGDHVGVGGFDTFHNYITIRGFLLRAMIVLMDNRINMQKIDSRAHDQSSYHPTFSRSGTASRRAMQPCNCSRFHAGDGHAMPCNAMQCNGRTSVKTLLLEPVQTQGS